MRLLIWLAAIVCILEIRASVALADASSPVAAIAVHSRSKNCKKRVQESGPNPMLWTYRAIQSGEVQASRVATPDSTPMATPFIDYGSALSFVRFSFWLHFDDGRIASRTRDRSL